ncbi:MAG TPA: Hint domain-containing protein [Stellaceae bacterium]|nr:Hint domain-containing protein [Stellaceae bacterium]
MDSFLPNREGKLNSVNTDDSQTNHASVEKVIAGAATRNPDTGSAPATTSVAAILNSGSLSSAHGARPKSSIGAADAHGVPTTGRGDEGATSSPATASALDRLDASAGIPFFGDPGLTSLTDISVADTLGSNGSRFGSAESGNAATSAAASDSSAAPVASSANVVDSAFTQLGPSPIEGILQSVDAPPNGTLAGAVQAIVTDPAAVNTIWLGGVDGGIWVTHDGGATWTPLTDKQASLSIASLSLDPTDATNNTLIAGIGLTSNGTVGSFATNESFFLGDGGQRTGILYSTDGGSTWSTPAGDATLAGQSVVGVIARGSTLLAATFEPWSYNSGSSEQNTGGLYISTNTGATFTQVGTSTGLGAGPVTSLVGTPDSTSTLYAAVTQQTDHSKTAVYVSTDTGQTWTQIFGSAQTGLISSGGDQMIARVATAAGGQIAVGLVDAKTGVLDGLFLSTNSGSTWTSLTVPSINAGGQGVINFAIAIDPTHSGVVYVSGDRISGSPFTVTAYRVTTGGAVSLTDSGNTGNATTVHADSRVITFDANGRLIFGTDGGIYARTSPTTTTGDWSGLNGSNLALLQPYDISFDGNSDRLAVAAQDNGAAFESTAGGQQFSPLQGGDGINAQVNDQTAGSDSAIYTSSQFLGGLSRYVVDSNGSPFGPTPNLSVVFTGTDASYNPGFSSPFVLNKIDPSRIAIGAQNVYVTQDTLSNINTSQSNDTLALTDVGSLGGSAGGFDVYNLAYGAADNTGALLASGFDPHTLWVSTAATPGPGTLSAVTAYGGIQPTGLAFDLRTEHRFFAADSNDLWYTTNTGGLFTSLTSNLTAIDVFRPTSVEFIANNGVDAVLVGGLNSAANQQSPIAVADSDSSGNLSGWRQFGTGLPNTLVGRMNYDEKSDTLAVGMFGRGGWVLYDVTSNFSSATVLQFGLANNNSTPDASLLTGSRALQKYGTGTLTISGTATYTGGSTINAGTLQLNSGASIGGTITFNGATGNLGLGNDLGFSNTLAGMDVGSGGAKTNFVDIEGHTVTISGITGEGTTSGSITLSDGTVLNLTNLSSTTWFANTTGDGGGTDIYVSDTACYCRGTMILMEDGEMPIEDLAIGDRVVTLSGEAKPIKWIGRRAYAGYFIAGNTAVLPIRIAEGALADAVPRRELWVSPEHALYFDGALVPAGHLVNGESIVQAEAVEEVEYFHIELAEHDVIFAEGAPAETYIDDDNRGVFHNAAEFRRRYPDAPVREAAAYCAPRLEEGFALEALRRRLLGRARRLGEGGKAAPTNELRGYLDRVDNSRIEGWAFDPAAPDTAVALVVLDNGAEIGRVVADRYRLDLEADRIGDGRHGFEMVVPGGLAAGVRHEIEVRREADWSPLHHSPQVLGLAPLPAAAASPLGALRGQLDGCDRRLIWGWAQDSADPGRRVGLRVKLNGEVIGRVLANRFRADLEGDGIGDGRHGFELRLELGLELPGPSRLSPLEPHEIRVEREADGVELPGSPLTLPAAHGFNAGIADHLATLLASTAEGAAEDRALAFLTHQTDRLLARRAERHGGAAEREAHRLFRRRWGRPEASGSRPHEAPRLRALVVNATVPGAAQDGGSVALLSHARALSALGYEVSLAAADEMGHEAALARLAAAEAIATCGGPHYSCVEDVLCRQAGTFDLVYLHRAAIADRYLPLARRYCPKARILYSVGDLHHLRAARQAQVERRPELMAHSRYLAHIETGAARRADIVITHSPVEAELLRRAVGFGKVQIVPFAVAPRPTARPVAERHGMAILGSFDHAPNPDAVHYLARDILPRVWAADPTITCKIVGHGWHAGRLPGLDPRIAMIGAVEDLDDVFGTVRLTVAPLRFGAGIKSKVIDSFAAGLPCVMTRVAAEGLALTGSLPQLVSDDPAGLAERIVRLHADARANDEASLDGARLAAQQFSAERVVDRLREILSPFGSAADNPSRDTPTRVSIA